ncbi:MAG: methyltransferase domain-containing protein [Chloroflexi bacterium]|nr:methyltransferase domain-containing protein [Chloroflexota bacterium]MCL5276040.1 methyltransferase domain-containing protein [Chloroflexota bacterium]
MNTEAHRFDPVHLDRLLSPQRQARWAPKDFLSRFDIGAGQRVVDLGCGPGFWTLPLAEKVGAGGTVYALDVSQDMLNALANRQPPETVRLLRSELPAINLPDKSADWLWAAFVLHEVTPLDVQVREMRRVGQRAAILDWRPDAQGEAGPPRAERLWPEEVIKVLKANGFQQASQTWQDDDNYLIEASASA